MPDKKEKAANAAHQTRAPKQPRRTRFRQAFISIA